MTLTRLSSPIPQPGSTATAGTTSPALADPKAAAWLLAQPTVAEADEALRTSLQSTLNVTVTVETRLMFPETGKPYRVPSGSSVAALDPDNVARAVSRMEAAMSPADTRQAEKWLVVLQAATAGGKKSEASVAVAYELYAGALSRYPADVTRDACKKLAAKMWFPTLGELIAECDALVQPRQTMLAGLRSWKPETEKQRLEREALDWLDAAYKADHDKVALARRDIDAASEAAEFSPIAWANYKRLLAEAKAAP